MPSLSPTFSTLSTSPRRCHPPSDMTIILELASWRENAASSLRSRPEALMGRGAGKLDRKRSLPFSTHFWR